MFELQVQKTPDAIAVVTEQRSLTYRDLNQKADALAATLRQMGLRTNSLVGLCVDRAAEMVIGILGILKAGGAYVPLDPNYPIDRLQFMLTDTAVSILLTQSWLVERLPQVQAQVVCLDYPLPINLHHYELPSVVADQLAYVIYTSGSTGMPKGVLLTHRGLWNVVEAQRQIFPVFDRNRVLQFSSLSFDASIFEIALAFGTGGTLYIPPASARLPGRALIQFLQNHAITHALLTPAVLAVLPAAKLPDLQVLITGGEACSNQVVDRWAADRHFFNAYGPTETTIWATVAQLYPGNHPLIIGRPIGNTQTYILDNHLNFLPAGVPGELYIGGEGLAQGYLNRPGLTAERFINLQLPSDLRTAKSIRLYKTGDRAVYRTNGTIEFLGRLDHQIKMRGFRVELGEIEATLQQHPAVQEAAVIAAGDTSSDMRLFAYYSLTSLAKLAAYPPLQQKMRQLQNEQIQQWQTLYNTTYQLTDRTPQFDITGWNSSYTGEPIPLEQMQEWVNDRVQQILALKPQRVLEIGCGTGLLLWQIAPHCQRYVATDFSAVALAAIQKQLEAGSLSHVELLQRTATDFDGIDFASFDLVILNSIVQYFPNADYLMQVLSSAVQRVAAGGILFIGDVRSLPLLPAFHSWMQFCQADAAITCAELRQKVDRSQFEEPELAIDPAFFYGLRDRFSKIDQVQIRLSKGHSQNEMTQFRYNVLLHFKSDRLEQNVCPESAFQISPENQYDWNPAITLAHIQEILIEREPDQLMITNVTNGRVNHAIKVTEWIRDQTAPKTVGRMREQLQNSVEQAIDPQDWWDLEAALPYRVEITWSLSTQTGAYHVLLTRQGVNSKFDWARVQPIDPTDDSYTNDPLQAEFARQLIPELRHHLRQVLPDYMIPAAFVPLKTMPLTPSGKIDRRALLSLNEDLRSSSQINPTTLTQTQTQLIEIWQELLRLKQVNIADNFFELGGHSLLATQMMARIRDVFGVELPLKSIFECPTIAQLTPILESLQHCETTQKMPPLVRLDRSAYRHKRSPLPDNQAAMPLSFPESNIPAELTTTNQLNPQPSVSDARSPLIPLTLEGNKSPFFCVHPMFGVVFPYLELAHHLNCDRSFYGLQPLGLDGKSAPLNRMEAIAAYYIQAIQSVQPQGPYLIGGWSFGGLVAFEMAQQLTQAGQSIDLLAILDTPAPCYKPSLMQSLKFLLGTALWSTLPFLLDYGTLATQRLRASRFTQWQWSAIARLIPEESRLRLLDESAIAPLLRIVYANAQATYRYMPRSYPDRITLFKATETSEAIGKDLTLGWSALTKDIRLHRVPGNHLSLLKQPHVEVLAQQLRQYL